MNSTIFDALALQQATARLSLSGVQVVLLVALAAFTYAVWEQYWFQSARKRPEGGLVVGPSRMTPLVGGIIDMVLHPYEFWDRQRRWAERSGVGMSCNSLVGKMILFVTEVDTCREVLAVNDPDRMLMTLHPSAKNILGPNNLAFMHGPDHKLIRKSFVSLFTRKALGTYVNIQDGLIREHLAAWQSDGLGEREIRDQLRDLNQETSQRVFLGRYLPPGPERDAFSAGYRAITDGFLAFPLCVPGTTVWKARQGRFAVLRVLERCATDSLRHSAAGLEPTCLLDYWTERCLKEVADAEAAGEAPPPHTAPLRIADAMLDFLFASQDASTASLTWCVAILADRPDVLAKVRAEQAAVRGADRDRTIDAETLYRMTYTRAVVKEVLRYRAPAPMVPQLALADYPLKDGYVVPKGTLVIPSLNAVTLSGFTDAETFDPDRFSEARKEDLVHGKHFVTFGHGPHYCVGKEYAINQLTAFLAILSTTLNWQRRRTDKSDDWIYLPTIYPHDAFITYSPRSDEEHLGDVARAKVAAAEKAAAEAAAGAKAPVVGTPLVAVAA